MKYKWLCLFLVVNFCTLYGQTINSIQYQGNTKIKTAVLQKLTQLSAGQVLDSLVITKDIYQISRLPACSKSTFKVVKRTANPKEVDVIYVVEETNTLIPTINFWTANNQEFAYQLGINEFNLFGENKQIGAFYRNNGFHSFFLSYIDPFFWSTTTGLSITLQSLTSLEPLFFSQGSANYKYTNSSIEVTSFKRLTSVHQLDFGINYFEEKYNYVNGFQSSNVLTALTELKLLFKTIFDYNKLIYHYQYVSGFRSLLNLQHVTPLSKKQRPFSIAWNDFFYYKRIREKDNLATRLRLGVASNDNTPFSPFALDNNLNIRGVGNIIDRGTAVWVLNAEYRHTLLDKNWFVLQSNFFVDAGNWRAAGESLKELIEIEGARIHPGFGLRFIHKKIYNAVLRVDYGFSVINDRQQGFVFGIGQYF